MVVIPEHLHDHSSYCKDLEQVLEKHVKTLDLEHVFLEQEYGVLTEQEHEELASNFSRDPTTLPRKIKELLVLYKAAKRVMKLRAKHNHIKVDRVEKSEFRARWKPFRDANLRWKKYSTAWQEGIEEHKALRETEIQVWKDMEIPTQASKMLHLTITYREGRIEQCKAFEISNHALVQDLIRMAQYEFSISLSPQHTLLLFSTAGSLKADSKLSEFRARKIIHLFLYRVRLLESAVRPD